MRGIGATAMPITHDHVLGVASLPLLHGDPFDRLLAAQALQLGARRSSPPMRSSRATR